MSRWHKSTCDQPEVVVQAGTPHCRACHSSPDIATIIAQQKFAGGFSKAPEDEPLGQLNLSWPTSVHYVSASARSTQDTPGPTQPAKPVSSPIYPSRLGQDEFRLLYLSPSTKRGDPIHAEFDAYKLERCPEYEATSYTWAGEDGDGSLCEPIFLGPYWDALLQTRNCWSMLQSMRPLDKAFRVVWVDAICINQNDMEERDAQVSRMSQIYSGCRRVFVYLGPDVSPTSDRHPMRRQLRLSTEPTGRKPSSDEVDLLSLLKRRYFSRVWVIQELLLSRQAVIQMGDVEFWIDPSTIASLSTSWEQTPAPWFEHLGQRRFQDKDLYQILRATCRSQCGDIRDKVFGMLALFAQGSSQPFQASYRLSCQHVFVGVFSHIVLNLKHVSVLLHAAGRRAWGRHPSWVPNWNASGPDWIFRYPEVSGMQAVESWKDTLADLSDSTIFHVSAEPKRWNTEQEYNVDFIWLAWYDFAIFEDDQYDRFNTANLKQTCVASFEQIWHRDATVDAMTGKLSINLIHLLQFPSSPTMASRSGPLSSFSVQCKTAAICLVSDTRLDKHVMRGDHLFILNTDKSCFYLIMRRLDPSTFRILACCNHVAFKVLSQSLQTPWQDAMIERRYMHFKNRPGGGPWVLDRLRKLVYPPERSIYLSDLRNSLFQSLREVDVVTIIHSDEEQLLNVFLDTKYQKALKRESTWKAGYPKLSERDASSSLERIGIMPAFQGLLNERRGSTPGFLESYVDCLPASMCAIVQDDHVVVTVDSGEWDPQTSIYEELEGDVQTEQKGRKTLRASKSDLERIISDTLTFRALVELTPAFELTKEAETDMARRGTRGPDWPRREDHFVQWSRWPKDVMECFNIDGSTWRVSIM